MKMSFRPGSTEEFTLGHKNERAVAKIQRPVNGGETALIRFFERIVDQYHQCSVGLHLCTGLHNRSRLEFLVRRIGVIQYPRDGERSAVLTGGWQCFNGSKS